MNSLHLRIEKRLRERIDAAECKAPAARGPIDLKPLMSRLDEVIRVVEGIRDYSVEPYRERVREIVCATCRQDASGNCRTRENGLCGLDKYFDVIVAVVEEELKADPGLPDEAPPVAR
jgi:hypothetical protein